MLSELVSKALSARIDFCLLLALSAVEDEVVGAAGEREEAEGEENEDEEEEESSTEDSSSSEESGAEDEGADDEGPEDDEEEEEEAATMPITKEQQEAEEEELGKVCKFSTRNFLDSAQYKRFDQLCG